MREIETNLEEVTEVTPSTEEPVANNDSTVEESIGESNGITENITIQERNSTPAEVAVETTKEKKPVNKKLIGIIIGAVVAVILIAFCVVFFTVIQPNSIYNDAVAALERSDFQECQRLIDKIPNHKETPTLKKELTYKMAERYVSDGELDLAESLLVSMPGDPRAQEIKREIQYLRAAELVNQEKYVDAKLLLDKIPDHADPQQLRQKIDYAEAFALLETGDYKTAYELFSKLGNYEDAATQKETVYYEALAFKSLFNIQKTLKNPASLRVSKVTFYKDASSEGELDAIYEINATNSFGGSLGAYAFDLTLFDESDDSGMISQSKYVDPDDYIDALYQLAIDAIKKQPVVNTSVDVARMNRLITANASFNIDLPFKAADVVES